MDRCPPLWEIQYDTGWEPIEEEIKEALEMAKKKGKETIKVQQMDTDHLLEISEGASSPADIMGNEKVYDLFKGCRVDIQSGHVHKIRRNHVELCTDVEIKDHEGWHEKETFCKFAEQRNWRSMFSILEREPALVNFHSPSLPWASIHYIAAYGPLSVLSRFVTEFMADRELLTTDRQTALQIAQRHRQPDDAVLQYIMSWEANAEPVDTACRTLCSLAMAARWPDVINTLEATPGLAHMRPNDVDYAVLHCAAHHGNLFMLQKLVEEFGVDYDLETKTGKTAFQIAREECRCDAVEYLGSLRPQLVLERSLVRFPLPQLVRITSTKMLDNLQHLLDCTVKPPPRNFTRDRGKKGTPVPSSYTLVGAMRSENLSTWRVYTVQREVVANYVSEDIEGCPFRLWPPWTKTGPNGSPDLSLFKLRDNINEWVLFHGTSPEVTHRLAHSGFSMSKIGLGATKDWGTLPLYGYGAYFTDSITKADEYCRVKVQGGPFKGCRAVALCRVLGGRYLYCEDDSLDKKTLKEKILNGNYDSTVGDRLKLRGTFHEYVVYDASSVYLEYILYFKRNYKDLSKVLPEDRD